ncbi:hypothetical protein ACWPOB_21915 [Rhodococcus sp. 2H158]
MDGRSDSRIVLDDPSQGLVGCRRDTDANAVHAADDLLPRIGPGNECFGK